MYDTSGSHPDIHWPSGFSPADAHGYHRARAIVRASAERAFDQLTDVANWSTWVPALDEVSTDAFQQTFEVRWAGHRFEVFVGEHVPPHRLGWLGIGGGVQLYQAWLFTEDERGTEIVVENALRTGAPKALDTVSREWALRLDELCGAQLAKLSELPPDEPRA